MTVICSDLIHIQTLFDKFHPRTKLRPEVLSLSTIMAKVHVFIVFKLMTSSDFFYNKELSKTKTNFKKFGVVHRWSTKWSVEGVHGVVHGRGPRGGPWTGGHCFQLSLRDGHKFRL